MKTKSYKAIALFVICVLFLSALCGCGGKSDVPQAAVILKGLTTSYWFSVDAGAKQAAEDLGFEVEILAPTTPDSNEQQLQLLEEAVNNRYDVICISPADSQGIISGVELANEAGIPVVNYATQIVGDVDVAARMRVEDFDASYRVAHALCEMMGSGQVVILEGIAGQQNALDKTEGAKAAIAEFPGIELMACQTANWLRSEAYTVTQNLLQAYPDLKGIIAANDDMALGAVQAVEELGRSGEVFISGMNCATFAMEALKEGQISVTIDIMAYELGYMAVETAWKIATGQEYESDVVVVTELCTPENVDDMMAKHAAYGIE